VHTDPSTDVASTQAAHGDESPSAHSARHET
jgi:hypothetical protein